MCLTTHFVARYLIFVFLFCHFIEKIARPAADIIWLKGDLLYPSTTFYQMNGTTRSQVTLYLTRSDLLADLTCQAIFNNDTVLKESSVVIDINCKLQDISE